VVDENLEERREEAGKGELIVAEEATKFMNWTKALDAAPTIVALREKLERIRRDELERLNGKLSDLGPEEIEAVEMITRSIINKIVHDPIVFLKKTGAGSKRNIYLDTARRLFDLDGFPTDPHSGEEEPWQK